MNGIKILIFVSLFGSPTADAGVLCTDARFNCTKWGCDNEEHQESLCARFAPRIEGIESLNNMTEIPFDNEGILGLQGVQIPLPLVHRGPDQSRTQR